MLGYIIALLVVVVLILVIEKLTAGSDGEGCFSKGMYFLAATLILFIVLDTCSGKPPNSSTQSSVGVPGANTNAAPVKQTVVDPAVAGSWVNDEMTLAIELNPEGAGWVLTYTADDRNTYLEAGSTYETSFGAIVLIRDAASVHVFGYNGTEWDEKSQGGNLKVPYTASNQGKLVINLSAGKTVVLNLK